MTKQAKFLYAEGYGWNTTLWYEYRGHTYAVNNGLYTSAAEQHRMEQDTIDSICEREERMAQQDDGKDHSPDWNEIWEMLGWND